MIAVFRRTFIATKVFAPCCIGSWAVSILLLVPSIARAQVTLTASDAGTVTSFNTAGNWSNLAAPSAGNDYLVGGGLTLQTPNNGTSVTFAGNTLTIGDGGATAATLLYAGTATGTITVNGLFLNNGVIANGTAVSLPVIAGSITLLSGGGTIDTDGNNHSIAITAPIFGTGGLTLENSAGGTPSGNGIYIHSSNAILSTYTGATTIAANTRVLAGNAAIFGDSSSVTLNSGSFLEWANETGSFNNLSGTAGSTIDANLASGGAALTVNQTIDGTFAGNITYSAVGGTFGFVKIGSATLTLSGASNSLNSTIVAGNGVLRLDASTGAFTAATPNAIRTGGGTFWYDNTNTVGGAKSQSFGALNFVNGDGTIKATRGGASSSTLTFASAAASTGATGNFVTTDGANGVSNSINVTGQAAGFISSSIFFDGASYAAMNATGTYVRALVYGSDAGTSAVNTTGAALTGSTHNSVTTTSINGQASATVNTIQFGGSGAVNLGLANNAKLTLTNGGLLVSGGTSTTISGTGAAITTTAGANTEYVFRTDSASDNLTVNVAIQNQTTLTVSNALLKSGAGTLTLGAANTYQGITYVDGGILSISQNSNLGNVVTGASVSLNNGELQATSTFGLYNGSAGTNNRAVLVENNSDIDVTGSNALTIAGVVSNGSINAVVTPGNLTKSNTGTLILTGANTYGGGGSNGTAAGTTVRGGTLLVNNTSGSGTGTGSVAVASGARLGGSGTMNPTGVSTVTVSAGGVLAPGTAGNTDTLTLNAFGNANNTGNVTTGAGASYQNGAPMLVLTGATLAFNLGASNTASNLNLTSSYANEVSGLGGSLTYNFTDLTGGTLAPGEYTLIESDQSVSGGVNPFSGLNLGVISGTITGLSAYSDDTLQLQLTQLTNGDYGIQLDIIAAPEPSTWAMMLGGFALLVCYQRRRSNG